MSVQTSIFGKLSALGVTLLALRVAAFALSIIPADAFIIGRSGLEAVVSREERYLLGTNMLDTTSAAPESLENPVEATASYRDEEAGFALDYPASWSVLNTRRPDEYGAGYETIFASWPLTSANMETPRGETRLDVTVVRWAAPDLKQPVAILERAWEAAGFSVITKEERLLANNFTASRFFIATPDQGIVLFQVSRIGDRIVLFGGRGNLVLLERIASTVHSAETRN